MQGQRNRFVRLTTTFATLAAFALTTGLASAQGPTSGDQVPQFMEDPPELFLFEDPPSAELLDLPPVLVPEIGSAAEPAPLVNCNGREPGIAVFNDSPSEVVVKLRTAGKPCRLIHIPPNQIGRIALIASGQYTMQYASGIGWEPASQAFTQRLVAYCAIADALGFGGQATVTLTLATGTCVGGRLGRIDKAAWFK